MEAKYFKSKKNTSPIALVLQPHPQYGGTMNNRVVQEAYNVFIKNGFSVLFVLSEGKRYSISTIDIDVSLNDLPNIDFRSLVPINDGEWYNVRRLEKGISNINNKCK